MNDETAQKLCALNNEFYRVNSASFSSTRQAPWSGWEQCAELCKDRWGCSENRAVLDLACGNLRFESFFAHAIPSTKFDFYAVDDCDELVGLSAINERDVTCSVPFVLSYQSLDVLQALQDKKDFVSSLTAPLCDLAVSFGFMHHIPLSSWRVKIIEALMDKVHTKGLVIVSFWQFLSDEGLARKAQRTHAEGRAALNLPELDEGDFLLGWKQETSAYRYCHSFSHEEVDALIYACSRRGRVVARFTADGRTNNLNEYVVWEVF